jgi:hypothetical protein
MNQENEGARVESQIDHIVCLAIEIAAQYGSEGREVSVDLLCDVVAKSFVEWFLSSKNHLIASLPRGDAETFLNRHLSEFKAWFRPRIELGLRTWKEQSTKHMN